MDIKKTLLSFLIINGLLFCSSAFAGYSVPKNIIEGTVFRNLTKPDTKTEKLKCDGTVKICRGVDHVKTNKRIIALTFDDGPDPKYTREILEILKQNNIHATFFFMGSNAAKHPEVVKEAYIGENVIGNHTYSHFYLTALSDDEVENELTKTNRLIHSIIGKYPALFRPPYGARSVKSSNIVNKLGFITVTWSDTTDDYNDGHTSPEKIVDAVMKLAKPGAIILLHDGGGDREKTVKALPVIIDKLKDDGYEFATIPELLKVDGYQEVESRVSATEKNDNKILLL